MRTVEVARALPDPEKMRRSVDRGAVAGIDPGHRALVVHQQAFVAGVKLDAPELLEVRSRGLHELDRLVDVASHLLVAHIGWIAGEALVPAVHLAEVGEPTLREGADKVQGRRCHVVALNESPRVRGARLRSELVTVDDVPAVCGQGDVTTSLIIA